MYALVDANNFYASCEKLFRPDLANKAVVVLSNNDGCIIARSKEAKALGISMGEPYFKVKNQLAKLNVNVFSSNYALYGDMSQRIINILEDACEDVEQYSIDEAFLKLNPALKSNMRDFVYSLRERVLKWTGIQVSIGLSQTKTLAKLANYLAKKGQGLCYLNVNDPRFCEYLQKIPVNEVWGIGRNFAIKLERIGIKTALDLKNADDNWIKKNLTVTGLNTVFELRGIPSVVEDSLSPRHSITTSRSFGTKIYAKNELFQTLCSFTFRACERLRKANLKAKSIQVLVRTSKHSSKDEFYSESIKLNLPSPSDDTKTFIRLVAKGLDAIYKEGFAYAKAGVLLFDLCSEKNIQASLLNLTNNDLENESNKSNNLMKTLDKLNNKYGKQCIFYAAQSTKKAEWYMKQEHKSKNMIGSWAELAQAKCK